MQTMKEYFKSKKTFYHIKKGCKRKRLLDNSLCVKCYEDSSPSFYLLLRENAENPNRLQSLANCNFAIKKEFINNLLIFPSVLVNLIEEYLYVDSEIWNIMYAPMDPTDPDERCCLWFVPSQSSLLSSFQLDLPNEDYFRLVSVQVHTNILYVGQINFHAQLRISKFPLHGQEGWSQMYEIKFPKPFSLWPTTWLTCFLVWEGDSIVVNDSENDLWEASKKDRFYRFHRLGQKKSLKAWNEYKRYLRETKKKLEEQDHFRITEFSGRFTLALHCCTASGTLDCKEIAGYLEPCLTNPKNKLWQVQMS